MRLLRHKDRHGLFPGKNVNAADMIGMLVGDEDAPQFGQRKPEPGHPLHDLLRAHACVDQNGIIVIFKIIAVAVTAGSDRGNFHNTFFLYRSLACPWLYLRLFRKCTRRPEWFGVCGFYRGLSRGKMSFQRTFLNIFLDVVALFLY